MSYDIFKAKSPSFYFHCCNTPESNLYHDSLKTWTGASWTLKPYVPMNYFWPDPEFSSHWQCGLVLTSANTSKGKKEEEETNREYQSSLEYSSLTEEKKKLAKTLRMSNRKGLLLDEKKKSIDCCTKRRKRSHPGFFILFRDLFCLYTYSFFCPCNVFSSLFCFFSL